MSGHLHDRSVRSEEQRLRDRQLIGAMEGPLSIGEQFAQSGETPPVDGADPAARWPDTPVDGIALPADRTPVASPLVGAGRAHRSRWTRMLAVGVAILGVVVAYFAVTLWQIWSTGRSDQARAVDAIVVMGAAQYDGRPSPQLEARLDHVLELWPNGLAPTVVVTGGNRPGDRFTEAEASAMYLIDRGVPESAIVMESAGTSSYESLDGVATLLAARGLDRVLIVTDPYHALRSRLIAEELGLDAFTSPTGTSVVTGEQEIERHLGEAAGVAVGRIIGFERLDDLTD